MFTSTLSFRHIHKHSRSIVRLGIKTDSTLMIVYVICWVGVMAIISINLLMYNFKTRYENQGDLEKAMRYDIAYVLGYILQWIFGASLDLVILFAYYRLGKKLKPESTCLIEQSLRTTITSSSNFKSSPPSGRLTYVDD